MIDSGKNVITPESVKALTCPTSGARQVVPSLPCFLWLLRISLLTPRNHAGYSCKLSENTHGLEFLEFQIKDKETSQVFFEVRF
jgi:hypothetical protein